jgi:alkanesulfonate monooxygenase SsuD/methylene tetrahydromethanopterin reductase-like flavin-dependent oxidoreductase (luciferase family)
MKFGAMVATRISDWQLLKFAEEHGYDHGWVPDSQMIWSDCYAVLALAAANTSRIRLGTGVAIAGTRIAPVTAAAIASINQIAPGRVFLGIGTGHTAMRVMGMDPVKPKEFREYLRVVRALLAGDEVEYTLRGETRAISFLHQDMGFFDVAHPVPIYVAANGPQALAAAGAYGDGRISAGGEPIGVFTNNLAKVRAGATAVGRELPADFHTACLTFGCVLKPGEKLTSERVIDEVGSMVTASLHFWWEIAKQQGSDAFIRPEVRDDWDRYLKYLDGLGIPEDRLHLRIHDGHCTYAHPDERQFVTPAMIRASGGLVGEPDEIIAMLREQEEMGLKEVTLLPPMACARENYADFARHVIERY